MTHLNNLYVEINEIINNVICKYLNNKIFKYLNNKIIKYLNNKYFDNIYINIAITLLIHKSSHNLTMPHSVV